jgi:WD40 repeat protein
MVFGTAASKENAHTDGIWSALWCGDVILTGSVDETVKCWNVSDGNLQSVYTVEGNRWGVVSVAAHTHHTRGGQFVRQSHYCV